MEQEREREKATNERTNERMRVEVNGIKLTAEACFMRSLHYIKNDFAGTIFVFPLLQK